jgi:cation diffusion facilitator family transporter
VSQDHDHDLAEHAHHEDVRAPGEAGERRTRWVVYLTVVTMVAEIVAGSITGSMALTADGWHMATHAGALGLALFAYWFARTRASSRRFSFGTGKVHALAGFASGVVLGVVALWMAYEAVVRLYQHPEVRFGEALPVAVVGLLVNLASVWLLAGAHGHAGHAHGHGGHAHGEKGDHDHHDHGHDHDHHDGHAHAEPGGNVHEAPRGPHDHNLRAAYLHVMADALTSVLAIIALVAGYYTNAWYLDPLMGAVGGVIIAKWSFGLCRDTAAQLLDVVPSEEIARKIERRLEADGLAVADLHVWELAPGQRGCIVAVVAAEPRAVADYRKMILEEVPLAHLTVEVHRCGRGHGAPA